MSIRRQIDINIEIALINMTKPRQIDVKLIENIDINDFTRRFSLQSP